MKGVCLTFYTYELQKHHEVLLYEWILEFAKKNQIHGGSVFRGIAGYGGRGIIHEAHFFELASNVPVEINFLIAKEQAEQFLQLVKEEKVQIFYSMHEVEYGILND